MHRISSPESERISELSSRLGPLEFRTLMSETGGPTRLMRPERLDNLIAGRGRISKAEQERLALIQTNAPLLENLSKKNANRKQQFKVRHALRNWLVSGKAKAVPYSEQDKEAKENQQRAIKALRFLGIDPSEGTYYVRKRKK